MWEPQLDSSGNLKVTGSLSVGGTTDNSAFTAGTSTGTPAMGFYHSTIDTVTDGRAAAAAITSKRALHSNLRDSSGGEVGTSSSPLQVTGANGTFPTEITKNVSVVSTNNSSSTPLLANATFTGTSEDLINYAQIDIAVLSDKSSATNGLQIQFSTDQTTWNFEEDFTVEGDVGRFFTLTPRARYVRLIYTNGATNQTTFSLVMRKQPVASPAFVSNIAQPVTVDAAVNVVKSVLAAQKQTDINPNYLNLQASSSGILLVDGSQATQPISGTVAATQSGTWTNTVTQATAASLNATVVGTGTFAVQNTPVAPTTVFNGKTTVTTAGTRVVLASSQAVKSVAIKALTTNTGTIYVGSSTVSSTNGFQLAAGDTVSLDIANLNTVNIDSSVNGEGVTYIGSN